MYRSSVVLDDAKRKQIERQLKDLQTLAVEPRRLPARADARTQLIEMTNLRTRLGLSLIAVRHLKPKMSAGTLGEFHYLC